jgi:succinyl-CoA synthetase beta subunit
MKIHEYQGKAVLAAFGVPVPKGKVAYTEKEVVGIAKELGPPVVPAGAARAAGSSWRAPPRRPRPWPRPCSA